MSKKKKKSQKFQVSLKKSVFTTKSSSNSILMDTEDVIKEFQKSIKGKTPPSIIVLDKEDQKKLKSALVDMIIRDNELLF